MTITKRDLDTKYAHWFQNVSQPEQARAEILKKFSEEPEPYEWTGISAAGPTLWGRYRMGTLP